MVRETAMWPYSLAIIIVSLGWWWRQPRPHFAVPTRMISTTRKVITCSVTIILIFCLSLLPLHIQWITGEKTIKEKTLNVQIVYDVSISMAATDILPSRFEAAKQSILHLIDNLSGYNIGIIAFAGQSIVHLPFSTNNTALYNAFSHTSFADFPPTDNFQGTAMGDAILLALKKLHSEAQRDSKSGIIILLTDGDANTGINPREAANIAGKANVPIYVLGIGREEQLIGRMHDGVRVTTSIDLALLESIAIASDGVFYKVFAQEDFISIFDTIGSLIKDHEKSTTHYETIKANNFFLLIIIGCCMFLLRTKYSDTNKII